MGKRKAKKQIPKKKEISLLEKHPNLNVLLALLGLAVLIWVLMIVF